MNETKEALISSDEKRNFVNRYLDKGFSIIPLQENSKLPIGKWSEFMKRKMTNSEIESIDWSKHNIGVVTGSISGIVVLDADTESAVELLMNLYPDTAKVKTKRGVHFYFLTKERINCGKIKNQNRNIEIDIKGEGGYVVAPPSIIDEYKYLWIEDENFVEISNEEIEKLKTYVENFEFEQKPNPTPKNKNLFYDNSVSKSLILHLLDELGIVYQKKGKSLTTRCPVCKGDQKIGQHNAMINEDTNTLYCFTEKRLYSFAELVEELKGIDVEAIYKKRLEQEKKNVKRTSAVKQEAVQKMESLYAQGFEETACYDYYDLNGNLLYSKIRFERVTEDGKIEKIFIFRQGESFRLPKEQKQIPYGLYRFLFNSLENIPEIWIVEGEKSADYVFKELYEHDYHRHCVCLGYSKPTDFKGFEYLFKNKKILIFEDNDTTGQINTQKLIEILKNHAEEISVVRFKEFGEGFDVADYLEKFSYEELIDKKVLHAEVLYTSPIKQIFYGIPDDDELPPQKEFILEPFIPDISFILFDGLGELGKSILAMQLSLCIAAGKPFLGMLTEPQKVFYLSAEDSEISIKRRLKLLTRGLKIKPEEIDRNFLWTSVLSRNFQCSTYRLLEKNLRGIQKTAFHDWLKSIIEIAQPKLIVLDSLSNFYGLDENATEHASIYVETLKFLAKEYNLSFLNLHHQKKDAMKKDGEKIFRGSIVFREQARCRFLIEKSKEEKVKRLNIEKLNLYTEKPREYYIKLSSVDENFEPCLCFIKTDDPSKNNENSKVKDKYGKKEIY